jgi:hypothetical protein
MMRAILTTGFLLLAIPASADTMTLASHYKANGTNPSGSTYTGTVDISVISDTTFNIVWKIEGVVYKGFGMRMNDTISATYMLDGEPGLVIYKAGSGGTFSGLWAVKGENGSGTETLTPVK